MEESIWVWAKTHETKIYISVSSLDMGTKDAMILFYLYLFV